MSLFCKTTFLVLFTLLFATTTTSALAEETAFLFHRPDFKDTALNKTVVTPAGEIELANGIKVPVFSLAMESGRVEDNEVFHPQSKKLNVEIKPDVAARLYAYAYPMGIILAPKNWPIRSAGVGADGSAELLFAPDTSGQTYLLYSNSGVCVGCAYSWASLYFDEAKKLARESDFSYYRRPSSLKMLRLSPFEKAYNFSVKDGNPVDGLAYFNADEDYPYFDVQVSLDKGDHALATALLNQFTTPKNRNKAASN